VIVGDGKRHYIEYLILGQRLQTYELVFMHLQFITYSEWAKKALEFLINTMDINKTTKRKAY
jgi:hypothetical protein